MKKQQITLIILLIVNSLSAFAETTFIDYQIKRRDSCSLSISVSLKTDEKGHVMVRMPNAGNIFSLSYGATSVATGEAGEFQLTSAVGKTITITYTLTNGDGPAIHPFYSKPVILDDYFYFTGSNGFAMSVIEDSAELFVKLNYVGFTEGKFLGTSYLLINKKEALPLRSTC